MNIYKCKNVITFFTLAGFTVFGIIQPNSVNSVLAKNTYDKKIEAKIDYEVVNYKDQIAKEDKRVERLEKEFFDLVSKNEETGKIVNMSFEKFSYLKENNIKFNIKDYIVNIPNTSEKQEKIQAYTSSAMNGINMFSSGSGGSTYYYNTGVTRPQKSVYTRYRLLSNVMAGDLVYEATGGAGITGHIAIVEGKFIYQKKSYIRLIEATPAYGVARGIVDDVRVDEHKVTILRVATSAKKKAGSVNFAVSQIGKGYYLDFKKNTSKSEEDWYCSELVWAAYKSQGTNLETSLGEPGVTPHDLYNSSLTYNVNFKYATK